MLVSHFLHIEVVALCQMHAQADEMENEEVGLNEIVINMRNQLMYDVNIATTKVLHFCQLSN